MVFTGRTRAVATRIGHVAESGIHRVVRMTRRRQLEWQIDRQYAALGRAVYPLLQTGAVHTDLPDALDRMAVIEALTEHLVAIHPVPMISALDRTAADENEER